MKRDLGMTVEEALSLEVMAGATLVAGERGKCRIIRSVEVMEVPDILDWVKEDEFLLTTGYSIKDDPDAIAGLIPSLAAKGLAALGVKPRRYLDRVPESMIRAADTYDFPLIEIPPHVSFADIMNPILTEIANKHAAYLVRSEEIHRQLTEVVLAGGDAADIAETVASLVGNPVLIQDHDGSVCALAQAGSGLSQQDFIAATETDHDRAGVPMEFEDNGASLFQGCMVMLGGRAVRKVSAPIIAGGSLFGHISVWEVNRPLRKLDLVTLERATTVVALDAINRRAVAEVERRYRNEFLDSLLSSGTPMGEAFAARARSFGLDPGKSYVAMVLSVKGDWMLQGRARPGDEAKTRALARVNAEFRDRDGVIVGEKGDSIVILVPVAEGGTVKSHAVPLAQRVLRSLESTKGLARVRIGVGRKSRTLGDISASYKEAQKALEAACYLHRKPKIVTFEELGVYRLLPLTAREDLESFYRETILPLKEYDAKKRGSLVLTLSTYFRCNGNLKKVSEELFTHYNTVVYRLEKIREITGLDLDDPDDRLNLQIGLKVAECGLGD